MIKEKKTIQGNANILPHNPLKAEHKPHFGPMEVFNHVKGLKGDKQGWYQFDLETLLKRFPDDKVLKQAYADLMLIQKASEASEKRLEQAHENRIADIKKKNASKNADRQIAAAVVGNRNHEKGNAKGRKTAAQLAKEKGKGKDSPATDQSPEDTADELRDIK